MYLKHIYDLHSQYIHRDTYTGNEDLYLPRDGLS